MLSDNKLTNVLYEGITLEPHDDYEYPRQYKGNAYVAIFQDKDFLELVQFRYKAEKTGLIDQEEAKYISNIEERIATKISERFDVEVDELYVEEESNERI